MAGAVLSLLKSTIITVVATFQISNSKGKMKLRWFPAVMDKDGLIYGTAGRVILQEHLHGAAIRC